MDTTQRSDLLALGTLLIALTGCGGGGETLDVAAVPGVGPWATSAVSAVSATAPASLSVKGCVVDESFIPRTGTPVKLVSADGRLLGNAISDGNGAFTIRVHARGTMAVSVDKPGGERFDVTVPVAGESASLQGCLRDPDA